MSEIDKFLPNGYQKIEDIGLNLSPHHPEHSFYLLDQQGALLSDDFDYGVNPELALYHVIHEAPISFPFENRLPPIMTQAIACLIAESIEKNDNLHLYAWDLLPAAVLLASRFTRLTVTLPVGGFKKEYPKFNYQPIISLLKRIFPKTIWQTSNPQKYSHDQASFILGLSPFQLINLNHIDAHQITLSKNSIFVVYWSALRGSRLRSTRKECIEAGLINSIIQIPSLSYEDKNRQFAIIEMGKSNKTKSIRMAKIDDSSSSSNSLIFIDNIVNLLHLPANFETGSMDVTINDIEDNITPEIYFMTFCLEINSRPLSDFAETFRCQAIRHVLPLIDRTTWGSMEKDRTFFARDIRQQDLEHDTGFVPADKNTGTYVKLPPSRFVDGYEKYILKQNDIIFAYRGSPVSIGEVGFVVEEGNVAIPGSLMCIIRAKNFNDAIWLYYYLRQPIVREWVLRHSAGVGFTKTLTTSLIEKIPILKPSAEEITKILAYHSKIVGVSWSIRNQQINLRDQISMLNQSFRLPSY